MNITKDLEEKIEVSEREYTAALIEQAQKYYIKYQTICQNITDLQNKINSGMIVKYYSDGKNMWYESKEKEKIGF